jgi:hypothetical protein
MDEAQTETRFLEALKDMIAPSQKAGFFRKPGLMDEAQTETRFLCAQRDTIALSRNRLSLGIRHCRVPTAEANKVSCFSA